MLLSMRATIIPALLLLYVQIRRCKENLKTMTAAPGTGQEATYFKLLASVFSCINHPHLKTQKGICCIFLWTWWTALSQMDCKAASEVLDGDRVQQISAENSRLSPGLSHRRNSSSSESSMQDSSYLLRRVLGFWVNSDRESASQIALTKLAKRIERMKKLAKRIDEFM